jgi:hypothetical protein
MGIPRNAQLEPLPQARNRIGFYRWDPIGRRWSKLLDVTNGGEFVEQDHAERQVRKHSLTLDARYFAARPFDVPAMYGTDEPF